MQRNNIRSIALEACTKQIMKEVCWSSRPQWKLQTETGTSFGHKSIQLNPILYNQHGTTTQGFPVSTALHRLQSICNSLIPLWQTISIYFIYHSVWKVMYTAQIKHRESRKLLTNGHHPLYFLGQSNPVVDFDTILSLGD
jgi:hypothetical protein